MIKNPIVGRELLGSLRTTQAIWLQTVLMVSLSGLVVLRWPADGQIQLGGQQSRQVLALFGYGLLACLMLLSPIFPATSLVKERRAGTLAILLNSPMSPVAILWGKLLGSLGFVWLLMILSLPAAAACYTMGGVDLQSQLLPMYLVLLALTLQYATLGFWISSHAASTDSALRLTFGGVLALGILSLGPQQFLGGLLSGVPAQIVDWIRCLSPIPAMMELLGHGTVGSNGLLSESHSASRYVLLSLISSAIFVTLILRRLNPAGIFDRSRAAGAITDEMGSGKQIMRRIMYLWFFDPQRRSGLIGPWTNPLMIKEFRTRRFGRSHWMLRLLGGCLIISMGLMLATTRGTKDWGVEKLGAIMVVLQMALILLVTPSLASGLISSERESGGWQLLQMTPLSAFSIVTGKLLSVIWPMALILMATLPAYGILVAIDPGQLPRVLQVLVSLVLTSAFCLLTSAAVSSMTQRSATATTLTYAILMGYCAGGFFFWLAQDAPFSARFVNAVLLWNPLAAALTLLNAPGFEHYQLIPGNWFVMCGLSALALTVLLVQTWRLTRPR